MVARVPRQGGAAWAVLQYVLGLRRLGHDVVLVEPVVGEGAFGADAVVTRLAAIARDAGIGDDWAVGGPTGVTGPAAGRVSGSPPWADLLLNLSGSLPLDTCTERIERRAYVDLDPAFTQLWRAVEGIEMGFAGHDRFVTVGQAVGRADCPVPTCGLRWIPTLPPVVLERWPVAHEPPRRGATTVAHWRGYGSVWHDGVRYGQKAHSVRALIGLPARVRTPVEVALGIHGNETADLAALRAHGWRLLDPAEVAGTPADYARFIRDSAMEIGLAKSGYVLSRCGWFSDRSACYLASGRPVVAQDTGFAAYLPAGEGLLAFADTDEAARGIAAVEAEPRRHARAARALAEEHLDSDRVLMRLLERLG